MENEKEQEQEAEAEVEGAGNELCSDVGSREMILVSVDCGMGVVAWELWHGSCVRSERKREPDAKNNPDVGLNCVQ